MAKSYKVYQSEYPYHIYNRTNNREYLFDLKADFPTFLRVIKAIALRTNFRPHHFVLMTNHFHLIGSTPDANLPEFMRRFQSTVSQAINAERNRTNHTFGSRYGATVIQTEEYMTKLIQYVYQNPIYAGMVGKPSDYPYSTMKFYRYNSLPAIGFQPDPLLSSRSADERSRLINDICNTELSDLELSAIGRKLKKQFI